jgi:hypothetical protein
MALGAGFLSDFDKPRVFFRWKIGEGLKNWLKPLIDKA